MGHESENARNAGRILLVDDEPDLTSGLRMYLKRRRYEVWTVGTAEEALEHLAGEPADLLLTDLMLPGMSGIELLKQVKHRFPEVFVILLTGYATVETAVESIREGAFDYVPKPFTPQQLEVVIQRVFRHKALTDENRSLRGQIRERFAFGNLIGQSDAMRQVQSLLARVAGTEANVLILGESGTGKELVARAIHANSRRQGRPFVTLDCASLPQNLMESELFGYEKGAFTGANSSHRGLIETADGGTFFMDEMGELDISLQVKLLRVLQERQFRRVGGARMVNVDVRFVAASNRNLEQEVKAGRFREDLFHRLNVIQVRLPALRERRGDVTPLANHFLQAHAERLGRSGCRFSPEALQAFERYTWPGNVRELQNAVEFAISLSDGQVIGVSELPPRVREVARALSSDRQGAPDRQGALSVGTLLGDEQTLEVHCELPYKEAKRLWLETFEREYFGELLRRNGFNISQAARDAGVDRKSIQRIMKRTDLDLGSLVDED